MKTFTAVDMNGLSIISVGAESKADAIVEIKEQLHRPGRTIYLTKWINTLRRLRPSERGEAASSSGWKRFGLPVEKDILLACLDAGQDFLVDAD